MSPSCPNVRAVGQPFCRHWVPDRARRLPLAPAPADVCVLVGPKFHVRGWGNTLLREKERGENRGQTSKASLGGLHAGLQTFDLPWVRTSK